MKSVSKRQLATIALAIGAGNFIFTLMIGGSLARPIEHTFFQCLGFIGLWLLLPQQSSHQDTNKK
jgi:branched-subunit amino acid permease